MKLDDPVSAKPKMKTVKKANKKVESKKPYILELENYSARTNEF